jgi:hypothetical protein
MFCICSTEIWWADQKAVESKEFQGTRFATRDAAGMKTRFFKKVINTDQWDHMLSRELIFVFVGDCAVLQEEVWDYEAGWLWSSAALDS